MLPYVLLTAGTLVSSYALFLGIRSAMLLAISIAANLEPQPMHRDRFDALHALTFTPALLIAIGFGLLTLMTVTTSFVRAP